MITKCVKRRAARNNDGYRSAVIRPGARGLGQRGSRITRRSSPLELRLVALRRLHGEGQKPATPSHLFVTGLHKARGILVFG